MILRLASSSFPQTKVLSMFEPRMWTMIVLSSLIAAPALWLVEVGTGMRSDVVRSGSGIYHLVSANSSDAAPVGIKKFLTAGHWLDNLRNGSDFSVSDQNRVARKGASDIVTARTH